MFNYIKPVYLQRFSSYDISKNPDQTSYKLNQMIDLMMSMWNYIYPIGCYFETSEAGFDPAKVWGGEWEDLGSGRWHRTA